MSIAIETRDRNAVYFNDIGEYTSIYKFISLNSKSWSLLEEMLKSRTIDGSDPSSLNDPFESNPYIVDDINEDTIRRAAQYTGKGGHVDLSATWLAKTHDEVRRRLNSFIKSTRGNARIISFCKRVDSQLLWSHYAASHEGICLHFSSGGFSTKGIRRGSVEYRTQRPSLFLSLVAKLALPKRNTLNTNDRIAWRKELYGAMFFVKPMDWAYEEEFRIIRSVASEEPVRFSEGGLLEVIFGARTSKLKRRRVRRLIQSSGLNVRFCEARISPTNFSVDVVPLDG